MTLQADTNTCLFMRECVGTDGAESLGHYRAGPSWSIKPLGLGHLSTQTSKVEAYLFAASQPLC